MPIKRHYDWLEQYVPQGARVLDLGCGDGTLLKKLIDEKKVQGCGIDIDMSCVEKCISIGVPVYHGDMLEGMAMFSDNSFECVILSQTLQQTLEPARVVREMLRVGERAIISFPNFAHWGIRLQILLKGRKPITGMLDCPWYETPNIHMVTIKDFVRFCKQEKLKIVDKIYLAASYRKVYELLGNLFATTAIFVLAG